MRCTAICLLVTAMFAAIFGSAAWSPAGDQPQWGQRFTRNMVSPERGLPVDFDPGQRETGGNGRIDMATTGNVKWVARLGNMTYGSPIVAEGRVLVGTNNDQPRDPRIQGDRGVLMCFDEATGEFLWQLNVPKLYEIKNADWHYCGITSPPTVEQGMAYVVSNRGEVMCLDLDGMADGNDGPYTDEGRHMAAAGEPPLEPGPRDADIVWLYDMVGGPLKVSPHNASNCSILILGELLYVCTSNGVEHTHTRVANPDAPTMIVVHKKTGKLVAVDDFGIGPHIIHGQWSSPALCRIDGKTHLCIGTGRGYLYAFEAVDPARIDEAPLALKNVWCFNGHPLAQTQEHVPLEHRHQTHSYEVVAMPVFDNGRVYVPFTQDPFHNMKEGWLTCLDATRTGETTRSGGLLWSYNTGACISTISIHEELIYIADHSGRVSCLDAETGRLYWSEDVGGPIWGSTLVADGKIYVGNLKCYLTILAAGRKPKVLAKIRFRDKIYSTPTAANGTLYVATTRHLYAIAEGPSRAE